jgi:hypothetical protein
VKSAPCYRLIPLRDAAEQRLANKLAAAVEIELSVLFIHRLTSEIIAT